jgi:Tfp pilus assembly protein PilO
MHLATTHLGGERMKRIRIALPDLSRFSLRERLLAAGVVFVLSVLCLDRLVLGPWWQHGQKVRGEIGRMENALRTHRQLVSRKPIIMAKVEAHSIYLKQATSGPEEVASLLREIEQMGKESGIALTEIKPLPHQESESFLQHAFEIYTTGTFRQWVHFVYLLQSSRSMFQIERANVGLKQPGSEMVEGSIRLVRRLFRPSGGHGTGR